MDIYKNSFSFHATRYEEWMNGRCLRKGFVESEIVAESTTTDIHFYISETGPLEINDSSVFEFTDEINELVLDRIIYYHETDSPESNEPVECQLFRDGAIISGIRFTFINPLRVIEFYGNTIEIGQPKRHIYKESSEIKTAESVLSHLKATYRYDADEIMTAAVKHFELYSDTATNEQIRGVVESLKLFIEVYKLLIEQTYNDGRTHLLLPKVCFFISICNLKIYNIEQAYAVAKEGLIKVNAALSESIFENLQPEVLGADDLKRVITDIENNYPQVLLSNDSNIVNPCIVDTRIIDSIEKNEHHKDGVIAEDSIFRHPNIPAIFIRRSGRSLQTYESGSIAIELPDVFVFESNEHQRYEYGSPVMGLQRCLRTIVVETNKSGCEGYKIKPGDGYVVKIYNNDTSNAQMSSKPMRLMQVTDSFIELRGYPLLAWSLFGWQPLDYSVYGFFIHYANGRITHCDLHMFDRNVRIEYRYTSPNDLIEESKDNISII